MTRPTLTYILPDKVGGVFSYVHNLLTHSTSDQFETHAILTHAVRDADTRSCAKLPAGKVTVFEHDLPGENVYAVIRRLSSLLPPGPGVVVTNDWLELAMLSVHDCGKMVVNITHGDYNYYYDLAQKHESVIDCFVAPSKRITQRLRETLPSRAEAIFYLPHGVEIPANQRSRANGHLRAIYVGRLDESKGIFALAEIDRVLRDRGVNVLWTVVGDGPAARRAREAWANASVHWTGSLPLQDVLQLYLCHDVFVLPSRAEGFPVTLAEAGAAGVVPVASDLPSGIPEIAILGETGYRVPVGDIAGFASALQELQREPDRLERMSAAVRQLVAEKFDIRHNVAQYDALYARFQGLRRLRGESRLHYGSRLDKKWLPNVLVRTVRSILRSRAH
ncbi:MAG: glycosyltransferase family 4 protein [Terriglobales bacterium]